MEICTNPDVLRVILFIVKLLEIVFFIVPVGLIIMLMIDFGKNVMAGKEEDMKKNASIAIKRIIYCVVLFLVPTIVSFANSILGELGVDYVQCLNNADIEYIEERTVEIAKEALATAKLERTATSIQDAENAISKISDDSLRESLEQQITTLKNEIKSGATSEESNQSNLESNSDFKNYGTGTENTYFAPIQDVSFTIGKFNSTAGCSNTNVSHDVSGVAEGTPIYAGIDGTAKFHQKYCATNNQLYSYGNMVTITAADGTYIIYAHLQKFADNVIENKTSSKYITKSCPKQGSSAPCPSSSCSGGVSTNIVATLQVKKGDLIGYLGNTGNSTGPHLHVEIHPQGAKTCITDPWKSFGMK